MQLKKPFYWASFHVIVILITIVFLSQTKYWSILFFLILSTYGFIKQAVYLAISNFRGGFMFSVDTSHITKTWFKIPNTRTDNPNDFLWAVRYEKKQNPDKIESKESEKQPYIVLAHGMGGCIEDLEMMSIPLALLGYHVIGFNQAGHGLPKHRSSGDGKDYTKVMINIHDIVDYILLQEDLAYDDKDNKSTNQPRIGFLGASTGGLMALTQAYLNKNIKVTIALSGIHDFQDLLAQKASYPKFSYSRYFLEMLKWMKVKTDYSDEENYIISPKQILTKDPNNEKRVFMAHCKDDPLPFSEALKNKEAAGIPDENCLFLEHGGHNFRAQETLVGSQVQEWIRCNL